MTQIDTISGQNSQIGQTRVQICIELGPCSLESKYAPYWHALIPATVISYTVSRAAGLGQFSKNLFSKRTNPNAYSDFSRLNIFFVCKNLVAVYKLLKIALRGKSSTSSNLYHSEFNSDVYLSFRGSEFVSKPAVGRFPQRIMTPNVPVALPIVVLIVAHNLECTRCCRA